MEDHESPDDCVSSHPGFHHACLNVCTWFKLQSTSTDNNTMKPFNTQQSKYSLYVHLFLLKSVQLILQINMGLKIIK